MVQLKPKNTRDFQDPQEAQEKQAQKQHSLADTLILQPAELWEKKNSVVLSQVCGTLL